MKTQTAVEELPVSPSMDSERGARLSHAQVQELPVAPARLAGLTGQDGQKVLGKKKAGTKAKKRAVGTVRGIDTMVRSEAKKKAVGTVRGIETMFRTAYRTHLDLTALAATKANIMISLNGFILSVLTLSGPFVLMSEPLFTIPIAVFLATCLTSIIFAVLAAQPRLMRTRQSLADFENDRANILVFEQFSALDEGEHLQAMKGLMGDNSRIYEHMTRQIYFLGTTADRKFRFLSVSYAAFLVGLTISTVLLLAIGLLHNTPDLATLLGQMRLRFAG
jgi:hypothetical protein